MNDNKEVNNQMSEEQTTEMMPEVLSVEKVPTANIAPIPDLPQGTPPPVQAGLGSDSVQADREVGGQNVTPLPATLAKQEPEKMKKAPRIIWGDVFSSWILALATVLVLILVVLFFLLKSGLLSLPFFAGAYDAPEPTRMVIAQPQTWDQFRNDLTNKLQAKSLDGELPIALDISEKEFTGLLQGVVDQGLRSPEYKAEIAQVVFLPNEIEMYFYITWKEIFQAQILAKMLPVLHNDGTVILEIKEAKIGDLPMPGDLSMQMIGYFFERDMGTWKIVLSNGYGIQDALLSDSSIRLLIGPLEP